MFDIQKVDVIYVLFNNAFWLGLICKGQMNKIIFIADGSTMKVLNLWKISDMILPPRTKMSFICSAF